MRFHLLGGVSIEEAEAAEAEHGHGWVTCDTQKPTGAGGLRTCGKESTAIVLRGPSGLTGDMQGFSCCDEHEAETLALIRQSDGYRGATTETRPAPVVN